MSRKFLVSIDLNKNELQNAVIQNLATAPATPADGQIYYNTADDTLYFWNGAAWINVVQQAEILYDTFANRPAAASGNTGALFFATDQNLLYFSNGTAWSQVSAFGNATSTTSYGDTASNGSANTYSRSDHTHGTPSLTSSAPQNQAIGDTAAVGTASTPARADHVHGMPSFGSVTAQTSFGASSGNGSGTSIARNDHTHGTPTHDNAAHSAINLSALAVPTADVPFATYKITGLGNPTADQDAATKVYVDSVAQGLDVKASVVYATAAALEAYTFTSTAGGTLTANANGELDIDGFIVSTVGTRILVKNETSGNAPYNGIYTVTDAGSLSTVWVLTRSTDANTSAEVTDGLFTFVEQGDTLASTSWVLTTNNPITLNTTALTFVQFSGAGTFTAGNGINITGNVISAVVQASAGLSLSGSGLAIDTAIVVRKYAASIGDGAATSYTVTHNLNTRDVQVTVYDNSSPYAEVVVDVQHATTNTITVLFSVAPTSNQYRVVVQG
jgi:hypothetical protein